jgi:P27 family predicted phage terminase small subunit
MRGRKPKPTRLKILNGTRADRINAREPTPPAGPPEVPKHLDELARDEWARLVPILEEMGVLSQADGAALMLYCECYSKWLRARGEIAKRGMTIEITKTITSKKGSTIETTGRLQANPAVLIEIQMMRLMKELLIEFGLTPSARSRISATGRIKADNLDDFLARQKAR